MRRMIPIMIAMALLNSTKALSQVDFKPKTDSVKKTLSFRILPQNFYTTHLSYTCKKEIQLQKLTGLPLFIRLGSIEQSDYLEGKTRYANMPICRYANSGYLTLKRY